MRDVLRRINARHHEALSRLFVVQVALVAACFLTMVDGPSPASPFLFILSLFVWPLVAAWPARNGRLLRGAMTNALAILFWLACIIYSDGWFVTLRDWRILLTILAFGIVSGMAAGGLVERWRTSRLCKTDQRLGAVAALPLHPASASCVFPATTGLPIVSTCCHTARASSIRPIRQNTPPMLK